MEDDDLRITHSPSDGPFHVVAFGGVGEGLGTIQVEEFRKSLEDATPRAVTYVIEKRRSWFNVTQDRVVDQVSRLIRPGQTTITLGNSMGGFGALYFASALPRCTRAIAFAPQFSVHPLHISRADNRWAEFRNAIPTHHIEHALDRASPDVDYIALFGGEKKLDMLHARRMAAVATPRTHIILVNDADHGVARHIKGKGGLKPVLGFLLGHEKLDPVQLVRLLRNQGVRAARFRARLAEAAARPAESAEVSLPAA
ncbi:alpha/beta fold hydrolase [Roseococcus thiosulfatophilus]|uniref:hypothetical protein n=1 Tax=Roseococcus thiosulfatophilus TaxID=35813 RepID=UPI001A8DD748|nr:hypothetical protein [Roseococcus thiosulfatophilus]